MLKLLSPSEVKPSVHDIDLAALAKRGIRFLLVDLDNTLAEVDTLEVSRAIAQWVEDTQGKGFRLCILSNSLPRRVKAFGQQLGVPALSKAVKPLPSAFLRALDRLGAQPHETAVVGDQLFTDVLGGNRLGLYTILINPLSRVELTHTRLIRRVERCVLDALRRRNYISERDWAIRCGGGAC